MKKRQKLRMPEIVVGVPKDPNYWIALGRFIETFAVAENVMLSLLAFYANVPRKMALPLFSGIRVDASIKHIRRMVAVDIPAAERRKQLEAILSQLDAINKARNDIIHGNPLGTMTGGRVCAKRAPLPENVRWRPMSIEVLDAMTDDLVKILTHVSLHIELPTIENTRAMLFELPPNEACFYEPPQDHEMKPNKG